MINKNTAIIALGLILVSIYVVLGIVDLLEEYFDQSEEILAENDILYVDPDDDNDNDEEQEDIEEEEPLVQCPPSRPVTPYELFEYNNNLLMKPSFRMING